MQTLIKEILRLLIRFLNHKKIASTAAWKRLALNVSKYSYSRLGNLQMCYYDDL